MVSPWSAAAEPAGDADWDPGASITGLYTGPYFDPLAPRNITAHLGAKATLPCTVRQIGDKTVSRRERADSLTHKATEQQPSHQELRNLRTISASKSHCCVDKRALLLIKSAR